MTPRQIITQSYIFSVVGWLSLVLCIYRAIVDINRGAFWIAIVLLIMAYLQVRVILVAQHQRDSVHLQKD